MRTREVVDQDGAPVHPEDGGAPLQLAYDMEEAGVEENVLSSGAWAIHGITMVKMMTKTDVE